MKSIFLSLCFLFYAGIAVSAPIEVCEYAGKLNAYNGEIWIRTIAERVSANRLKVRVLTRATARYFGFYVGHIIDEITDWQNGELTHVAVNVRDLRGSGVRYQKWDQFKKNGTHFEAYRAQGKDIQTIQSRHNVLAQFWSGPFGDNWLHVFASANAERRPDLDLTESFNPKTLSTPFAQSFYLIRFLDPRVTVVPVFVPGEKKQKKFDLPVAGVRMADGKIRWNTHIHIGEFHTDPDNPTTAMIDSQKRIQSMQIHLVHTFGSASGTLLPIGCK